MNPAEALDIHLTEPLPFKISDAQCVDCEKGSHNYTYAVQVSHSYAGTNAKLKIGKHHSCVDEIGRNLTRNMASPVVRQNIVTIMMLRDSFHYISLSFLRALGPILTLTLDLCSFCKQATSQEYQRAVDITE